MSYSVEFDEHVYVQCGLNVACMQWEQESVDYNACRFQINGLNVICRTAKTTPTKTGQFVTLWKRVADGPIQPFDNTDDIDLVVVNTTVGLNSGQFVFPKSVLVNHGVLSTNTKEGKRAIRVYPPWVKTTSKQAQKSQAWQLEYFININTDNTFDITRAKSLYAVR